MVSLQAALAAMALSGFGQTVLLDFYADWCGPCRAMNPTVEALIAAGYPVQRVNIDQNRPLAAKYGVQSIPCFVMVVDGREVDRVEGGTTFSRLERMCKAGASAASPPHRRRCLLKTTLRPTGPRATGRVSREQPPACLPNRRLHRPSSPFEDRGNPAVANQPASAPPTAAVPAFPMRPCWRPACGFASRTATDIPAARARSSTAAAARPWC